jgi:hypothetical protein
LTKWSIFASPRSCRTPIPHLTAAKGIDNITRVGIDTLATNMPGMLKRFKIIADRYRNRRRRFGLRFFLIAAIYNMELKLA